MKKIIILMSCLAVLFACEVKDNGADIDLSGYTRFSVDMEEITLGDFPDQRAWQDGDMIGVFGSEQGTNVGFFLKEASEGKTVAEFYGPLVKGSQVVAYFPYNRSVAIENGGLPCELAQVQVFDKEQSAQLQFLAYSSRAFAVLDNNEELHFAYPFGVLEVVVALDEAILMTGAKLSGVNPISGKFIIDAVGGISTTDLSCKNITLDFKGQEILSREGEQCAVLRFVLPPDAYSEGELVLQIQEKDGDIMEVHLEQVDVNRIDCSSFQISSVTVGLSDIPELDIKDGYLE